MFKNYFMLLMVLILSISLVNAAGFIDLNQTDFNKGQYNQTFYNTTLKSVQLNLTYGSGSYLSQIFDAGSLANWTNISWIQGAPYGQELPNNQGIENVLSGANMTGNVLLVHLNDGSGATAFADSSGNNKNGTCSGSSCPTWTTQGKFDGAYNFDGNDRIGTSITTAYTDFAVEVWFKDNGDNLQYERLADKSYTNCFWLGRNSNTPNSWGGGVRETGGAYGIFVTLKDGEWHQIVSVRQGTTHYIYGDGGQVIASNPVSSSACDSTPLAIGAWGDVASTQQRFTGSIDEVSFYNRSLSAAEILSHYKRGIARLNLSVKSCDDIDCSIESWNNTYTNQSTQKLNLKESKYFQFKAEFLTENKSYSPELYNVSIGYDILDNIPPTIELMTPENGSTNTTDKSPEFKFIVSDETAKNLRCSLWMNSSSLGLYESATNSTVLNGTLTIIKPTIPLSNQIYKWWINCSDGYNSNISEKREINISVPDTTPPLIELVSPQNNTINSTNNTPEFKFIPTDDLAEILLCSLWLNTTNGSLQQYGMASVSNGSIGTIIANSSLTNQNYTWWINCSDGANTNISNKRNIKIYVDTLAPVVSLINPNNNSIDFSNVNFTGLITDDIELKNVSLYSNFQGFWQLVETKVISGVSKFVSFVVDILPDNRFTNNNFIYNIKAYDNTSKSSWDSVNNTFSNWDLGTHHNTMYNQTLNALTLESYSQDGYYLSQIFDAGEVVGWKNISWDSNAINLETEINYFNDSQPKSYYSQVMYSVRQWYNVSEQVHDFSQVYVESALDCDGVCTGMIKVRIGNSTSYSDYDLLNANQVRTDATTSSYTFYNNTFNVTKGQVGDYFYVQLLLYTGQGTINFLMDETGPSGPSPQYRSGNNGDGTPSGWTNDNGDYAIKIKLLKDIGLNVSARSCDDLYCNGESWSKPLENSTLSLLEVPNNRYVQYKVNMQSIGSQDTPRLYNVTLRYGQSDTNPPIINLTSPKEGTGNNGNITNFIFNLTDESEIENCNLILNGIIYSSNSSIIKGINQEFSLSGLGIGNYRWSISCTDINGNQGSSQTRLFTIIPSYEYNGKTTDISQINIENITNLILENPGFGLINFSESINLSGGVDINRYVTIRQNFIEIDSVKVPQLNKPATLTLYNLSIENPIILKNNHPCTDCEIIDYSSENDLKFNVLHFSNYSAAENSQLEIWDDTDSKRVYSKEIYFYSNYTNTTDNEPITAANCQINFNDRSESMTYNITSQLFEYNRNLSVGVHFYNVSCSASGYTTINMIDSASIDSLRGPNGANVTEIKSERGTIQDPESSSAHAGNITGIDIFAHSITSSWQGYYGDVTGTIDLKDGFDNVLYNWSDVSSKGEVYATRAQNINFATSKCADSSEINLEESFIGHDSSDAESVTNTFNKNNHPEFHVGAIQINSDSCKSTNIFDDNGAQTTKFFNVLLSDAASNIVYTSILEPDSIGFDSMNYDFEMLVGENGQDSQSTPYYFYLEIY